MWWHTRRNQFRFPAKRTSPFKSMGASVQSTIGSRGVHISSSNDSNAGYTMFRGSVKGTGYQLHSPVSPSHPLPCVTVCHNMSTGSYVYWTVHHLGSWIKRGQLDATWFIISLFNAQHVSDVNTSILRSLRLMCWVILWVLLLWFDVCWSYVAVWLWWCGIRMQAEALLYLLDRAPFS